MTTHTLPVTGVLDHIVVRRAIAGLIDIAILAVLYGLFVALFSDSEVTSSSAYDGLSLLVSLLYAGIALAYYFGLEALYARTPGKAIMGLKVVTLDDGPYTFGRVLVRNLLRIVDGLPGFYLVGLIFILLTNEHQRLGDVAANTTVARA
jgi:uncharacterized RDD family membrane protein YckC